jgi:hypothetical protein
LGQAGEYVPPTSRKNQFSRPIAYNFFPRIRFGRWGIFNVISKGLDWPAFLGAWLPSLLWGEGITTPFGFLGAIAVQSTGHQFRMLLAKTPFVRVDVCIVRLPAPGQQTPSKSRCRIAPRRALSSVGVHHIERRADRYTRAGRKRLSRLKQPCNAIAVLE